MPEGFLDVAIIAMYGKTWALEENYQRLERYFARQPPTARNW